MRTITVLRQLPRKQQHEQTGQHRREQPFDRYVFHSGIDENRLIEQQVHLYALWCGSAAAPASFAFN